MDIGERIQEQIRQLSPAQQSEVYEFILSLRRKLDANLNDCKPHNLRQHPAFGLWRGRNIDALNYQQTLRVEWDKLG